MKDILFTLTFIFFSFCLSSQVLVSELSFDSLFVGDSYPIISENEDRFALLVKDNSTIVLTHYDSVPHLLSSTVTSYKGSGFPIFLGGIFDDESICIYFTNINRNKVYLKKYSLETFDFSEAIEFEIYENEEIISAFIYQNKLLVLTNQKRNSIINAYFYSDREKQVKNYDFSDTWSVSSNYKFPLYKFLDPSKNLSKIGFDDLFNLFDAAKQSKVYLVGDEVIISMDQKPATTKLLVLNLKDGNKSLFNIRHENVETSEGVKSNSFINEDKLFVFSLGSKEWLLLVYNLKTREHLNTLIINKKELSNFTNSSIFEKYVDTWIDYYNSKFVPVESTKHFRKISKLDPYMFFAFQDDRHVELVLGSCQYKSAEPNSMLNGNLNVKETILEEDYTVFGYSTAIDAKSFDYLSGVETKNNFLNIMSHLANFENQVDNSKARPIRKYHLNARKIFMFRNEVYLGYYFKENEKYFLYRF